MSFTVTQLAFSTALPGGSAHTSASFTPSNNSLLVVVFHPHDYNDAASFAGGLTVTDSLGTHLTYTSRVSVDSYGIDTSTVALKIWTAPVVTGASMTVSCDHPSVWMSPSGLRIYEITSSSGGIPLVTQAKGVVQSAVTDGAYSFDLDANPASASLLWATLLWSNYGSGFSVVGAGSGWTEILDYNYDSNQYVSQVQTKTGTTSPTIAWDDITTDGTPGWTLAGALEFSNPATVDQEGFRWGNDDASESAHTWLEAQDTNLTAALDTNTLLRVLVDATDDPASAAYTLRYQKNGSGGYVAVPVGASVTTSPSQVTSATVQSITTANASWALTNGRPAASAGDMIVAVVAWDDSTAVTSVTPPAGPNSEAATSIAGPIASASTEMRMQAWYWIATGSWTLGNWTYTPAASETCRQAAFVIPAGQFNAADPIGWANTRASTGTAESTLNSPTGTAEANDGSGRLFIAYGSDADAITAPASGTTTVSNGTTGGVGLCIVSRDTVVANSETITAISATITSDSWAALGFVVKPKVVTNEVYVSASANIAAGGEATTARLTAPSGKTTSDFVTGRRWDDENGTDTIDITADDYTELEWCLKAVSPAEDDDYYEFRVYAGTSALDTYTVTPKWTIVTTANKVVDVPKGTLSLTSFVPSVAVSDHKLVNVPQGSLLLFGLAPTVAATAHVTVSVPADALSLSTFVPTVTATGNVLISVPLATLSLAATAPLVLTGASQIVQVPKGTLTLAAEAPTVATTANQVVSVPKADLTLTSYEPSVVATANQKVDVPAASLELTGYAPTVSADGGTIVSVPFSSLELTLHAPTIVTPRVVSIPEAVLELVAYEPTIITPRLIDVPSTSLTLTSFAPEVHTTAVIEVPATSLTITGYAPSVDAGSGGGVASTRVTWG